MINDITIFDFETSGLDPEKDRVIEMAAITVRKGHVVGEFSALVHQPIELSAKITEITGITTEMMKAGMNETVAFKILRQFMGSSGILVAHNAPFDLQFLHHSMMRLAGKSFDNPFIDTLSISRDRFTFPHRLEPMCERLGIELNGAHRALNDVYGCWELLKALHAADPVDEWLNTLGYLNKYGPPKWVPAYARVIGQDNRYENAG